MNKSTISIKPIPLTATKEQLNNIFHAYSLKNIAINGDTAYVQFRDQGDLETLQMQFNDYQIPQLNNAKIDLAQSFDWNSIKQHNVQRKKQNHDSPQRHQDLMMADVKSLIVVQNCDKNILDSLSIQDIKNIFSQYTSVNRIIKRDNQVAIQFLDLNQIQLLEMKFDDFNVPQLGKNSRIQKAQDTKVTSHQFTSQWSKINTQQSQITQATTQLGYQDQREFIGEQSKSGLGYGQHPSQEVLHQDIIPPFDKKTSMQVNFLSEQSRIGYKEQKPSHQPIHEAGTHQELDYTSQVQISQNEQNDRFNLGYKKGQKQLQQAKERQQQQLRRVQQQQKIRKHQQQLKRKQQQQQKQRQRLMQQKRKQQEQLQRKKRQEEELMKKYEEEKKRKIQLQESMRRIQQEELKKRRQSELLEKDLKQKLKIQRQKFQNQQKIQQQKEAQQKESQHKIPTQGENATQQTEFIRDAGKNIQEQLGYAVNKAKQESANLINSGKQLLKNLNQNHPINIGYDKQTDKNNVPHQQKYGYEKWSVKPDVNITRPASGTQRQISKTLITVTLAVWVLFLLFQ